MYIGTFYFVCNKSAWKYFLIEEVAYLSRTQSRNRLWNYSRIQKGYITKRWVIFLNFKGGSISVAKAAILFSRSSYDRFYVVVCSMIQLSKDEGILRPSKFLPKYSGWSVRHRTNRRHSAVGEARGWRFALCLGLLSSGTYRCLHQREKNWYLMVWSRRGKAFHDGR